MGMLSVNFRIFLAVLLGTLSSSLVLSSSLSLPEQGPLRQKVLFQALHQAVGQDDFKAAPLEKMTRQEAPSHMSECTTPHKANSFAAPFVAGIRQILKMVAELPAKEAYPVLLGHAASLINGTNTPPVGLCAPVRGAHHAAKHVSSYEHAVRILKTAFQTILDNQKVFLGKDTLAILGRTLRMCRESAYGQIPVDTYWTIMYGMESLGWCPDLMPHAYYSAALLAARDGSIHPAYTEGFKILKAANTNLLRPGCQPREMICRVALKTEAAATSDKGRYWTLLMFGDRLLKTKQLSKKDRKILLPAVSKAWGSKYVLGSKLVRNAFLKLMESESSAP